MGVIIRRQYCTDSHLDFFTRNLTVCRSDAVASAHGYLSDPARIDIPAVGADLTLPLALEDAKAHLRVTSSDEDALIISWILAAWQKVERDTGLVLLTSEWRMYVHAYPAWNQPLRLPLWPIQSIDTFDYVDSAGVTQTVMSGSPASIPYIVDYGTRPVLLHLENEDTWPSDLRTNQPGTIEVTAGWTHPELIPADLLQAMRLLIGESDLNREHSVSGQGVTVTPVPIGYDQWIAPWVLPGV